MAPQIAASFFPVIKKIRGQISSVTEKGLIICRDASGTDLYKEKASGFQRIPKKNRCFCELSLLTKQTSNVVMSDSTEDESLNKWKSYQ